MIRSSGPIRFLTEDRVESSWLYRGSRLEYSWRPTGVRNAP